MNKVFLIGLSICFFSIGCQNFKETEVHNLGPNIVFKCKKVGTDIHLGIFNIGSEDVFIVVPSPRGEWDFLGVFEDKNKKEDILLFNRCLVLDNRECLKLLPACKGTTPLSVRFPSIIHLDSSFVEIDDLGNGTFKKEDIDNLHLKQLEVSCIYITLSELRTLKSLKSKWDLEEKLLFMSVKCDVSSFF